MGSDSKIIKTCGKGLLEERHGIRILHLRGTPYERGYQHGVLLADSISKALRGGITGAAAVIARTTGVSSGLEKLRVGKVAAEPYIPPEFREELHGIADGMKAAGSSLTYDDLLLWNTMYDARCFYAHLTPSDPTRPPVRHSYPPGCSSFSAWGRATPDGKLIFGKNMDNLNLPGILENRILMTVDPDHGYSHAFVTHPGMLAIDGGVNEDGIAMMTQYSGSINETMRGCGIGILTRLILQNVHRIDDAINILTVYPRCTGINYHVADAKVNGAVVIEVSANELAVRYPEQDKDTLCTTNHYNCYPGWKGYTGYNMVLGQAPAYGLTDISTAEKWQNSLLDRENAVIPAASRFMRYEQLLDENYGKITVEKGIEILSDRYDPVTSKERAWNEPSPGRNNGATISMLFSLFPKDMIAESVPYYKSDKRGPITAYESNLWSFVAVPSEGEIRLAMSDFPAQRGPYIHLNLKEMFKGNKE